MSDCVQAYKPQLDSKDATKIIHTYTHTQVYVYVYKKCY